MKITYEVRGYKTEWDFQNRHSSVTIDGLSKKQACVMAVTEMNDYDCQIMKVQSNDREEIWIIRKANL